ncbi:hypothetical protein MMMDOFMJ_3096 [Methylobacterium gnaphalii]|uniref:Uncharacterized protein n=1 Tax=Methylobacterium gnaphalii TaxID=1010610 RepID=A0A512JNJ9_9HYPH|nr:hypothetical protein MGN01_33570 [Methylobacterium gnaphalii]GJD70154.1 hypothetical protein MMMDOFMJ_3096 [Methylobacterium gnaphalii]GLS49516.1 hypothetical protein GCM10007885_23650 [Methylobacterium gnaphalii]
MNENRSKEWKRADAEFAKTQAPALQEISQEAAPSFLDEKSARLKAARLARDAADNDLTRKPLVKRG